MAKVFFESLPVTAYANLGGKRLKQCGRIVLWEVTTEEGQKTDPFWLVMVRGYKDKIDRPRLTELQVPDGEMEQRGLSQKNRL